MRIPQTARRKRLPAAGDVNSPKETPTIAARIFSSEKKLLRIAGLLITIATLIAYGQVRNFKFVNLDDGTFIYRNPIVQEGLSAEAIRWAILGGLSIPSMHTDYWQPVTQLSRLVDIELFGLNPGGHHLMNLLLHLSNSLLVILLFHRLTGSAGSAAFIAGVFALHPLQVESVAWVTERKNLLGALFGFLSILAYLRHAASPSRRRYSAVAGFFALSLMSKPIFLPLPFLLLLLDGWPIRRAGGIRANALEKIPLFLLSLASAGITLQTPTPIFEERSWFDRMANAPVSVVQQLERYFAPRNLATMYPPNAFPIPMLHLAAATLALIAISYCVAQFARKIPALVVGWIWFLAMLLPVLFLTEAGTADRFSYAADMGLSLMIAGAARQGGTTAARRRGIAAAGAGSLLILSIVTWYQVSIWRDTTSLFEHSIRVAPPGHASAHGILGETYIEQGRYSEAKKHLLTAIEIKPSDPAAWILLGNLALLEGNLQEARDRYIKTARLDPTSSLVQMNLARLADTQADRTAIAANANRNLGLALARDGKVEEAIFHFSEALRIQPSDDAARINLAILWAGSGRIAEAVHVLEEVIQRDPSNQVAKDALLFIRSGAL